MDPEHAQPLFEAYSPSGQVRTAAAQVGDLQAYTATGHPPLILGQSRSSSAEPNLRLLMFCSVELGVPFLGPRAVN